MNFTGNYGKGPSLTKRQIERGSDGKSRGAWKGLENTSKHQDVSKLYLSIRSSYEVSKEQAARTAKKYGNWADAKASLERNGAKKKPKKKKTTKK